MGAPLRPCSGLRRGPRLRPAGPFGASAVCGAVRSSRPSGRAVRPSLRAPPAPGGASGLRGPFWAPSGCRARAPPAGAFGRPLAVVVGGWFCPPASPPVVWLSFRLAGAAGPPPSGAWPGGCPGLVPPRAPHPAAGGGSRPAAGWSFTAGLCSLPPRTGNGGGVPPAAAPSACRPWHRSPSRYCSHDSTHGGPSRCLHTSP